MTTSGILIVHLRGHIPEPDLRADLARLLGLPAAEIQPLEQASADTLLPYQYFRRSRGFQTTVELYTGQAPGSIPRSDLELARLLADHYQQDALIDPAQPSTGPYQWLLVRPGGATQRVTEIPALDPTDDDGIVIDEPPRPDPRSGRRSQLIFGVMMAEPLDKLAGTVDQLLGVPLRRRSSLYFGGDYYLGGAPMQEQVYVHPNVDMASEGAPAPPAYADAAGYPFIVRIDRTTRSAAEVLSALRSALGCDVRLVRDQAIG